MTAVSQIAPRLNVMPRHDAVTFSLLLCVQALEGIAEHVDANMTSVSDATSKLQDVTSAGVMQLCEALMLLSTAVGIFFAAYITIRLFPRPASLS